MRSEAFRAATARQIAREYAGLPVGPGLDCAPPLPRSPLPLLRVDEINWEMAPTPTIPYEGGDLRASTIGYREVAQAACQALHGLQQQRDREAERMHRPHDELRNLRTSVSPSLVESSSEPPRTQSRLPIAGLSGVQGVRGL